jgi:hypothetical protein
MTSAKTPTLITSKKPVAKPVEPVEPTPATTVEPTVEPTADQAIEKPKSKLSWAEKMAALPPEEAKLARAKAAAASRVSKAKTRGTTPVIAATIRLTARLAKNTEQTKTLAAERAKIEAELAQLADQAAAEQTEDGENGQA